MILVATIQKRVMANRRGRKVMLLATIRKNESEAQSDMKKTDSFSQTKHLNSLSLSNCMDKSFKRQSLINRIVKTLTVLKEKDLTYDKKKFLNEIMIECSICEKTANEYLNCAISISEQKPDENILAEAEEILGI